MIQNLILDYDITKKLIEVQHDHILVKLDFDTFAAAASESARSLIELVSGIKEKAQVTHVTLLILNLKQSIKYVIQKTCFDFYS